MAGPSLTQTAIVFWSCISQNAVIVVPVVIVIFAAVWFLVEKKIGMEKIEPTPPSTTRCSSRRKRLLIQPGRVPAGPAPARLLPSI